MPPRPRAHLERLAPYEWEASAAEIAAAAGIAEANVARFDTNTAPWPPVAWEQTVLDVPRLPVNEYPHPSNEPLRSTLAQTLDVTPDQVVVTCGADEALFLVASVYHGPRRTAVLPAPSFSMFRVVSETVGARMVTVPLDDGWDIPRAETIAAATQPGVGVVWLCTPNNPTGRLLDPEIADEVARKAPDAVVAIDEAYYEFAGVTLAPLLRRYSNVVLVRTFSKGYGLAGARVGYLATSRTIARSLDAVRLPQNLSAFGIAAASRAFADQAGLRLRVSQLVAEREALRARLEARGWAVVPSEANFLLARPPVSAQALSEWLQGAGMVVRSYGVNPRLSDYLRITVRSPEEDARLLARIDAFDPGRMSG